MSTGPLLRLYSGGTLRLRGAQFENILATGMYRAQYS